MSKICAKCEKPVYPTEELKCLDKSWHKLCFKCWECGMSLNMKNYKGFEKKPYCSAHYPQLNATVVAETPELQRLTQASKNQSQAKYHEDFEKNIKGSKIEVVDDPESQRLKQLTSVMSEVEYKGLKEKVSDMEARRHNISQAISAGLTDATNGHKSSPYSDRSVSHSILYAGSGVKVDGQSQQRKVGSISDYEPPLSGLSPAHNSSSACRQEWEETIPMSNAQTQYQLYLEKQQQRQQQQSQQQQPIQQQVLEQQERLQQLQIQQNDQQQRLRQQQQQHEEQQRLKQEQEQLRLQQLKLQEQQTLQQQQRSPTHGQKRPVYQAMYDYEAQDADEVGFKENDIIMDPEPIDDGWMFGTVQRTGKRGMLPSNYVERVQ